MSVYNFEAADVEKAWEHLRLYESECHALLARYNELSKASGDRGGLVSGHDFSRAENGIEKDTALAAEAKDRDDRSGREPANDGPPDDRRPTTDDRLDRFPLLAAYELCLKCSHLFNILDARGAISVTARVGVIARIRQLAVGVAQ